eukprot:scaffold9487_cov105-Isochrysis_galbana.AAC.7
MTPRPSAPRARASAAPTGTICSSRTAPTTASRRRTRRPGPDAPRAPLQHTRSLAGPLQTGRLLRRGCPRPSIPGGLARGAWEIRAAVAPCRVCGPRQTGQ